MHSIYAIRHKESGKVYIGQAALPKARWSQHKGQLKSGKHTNTYLQNAWNRYGEVCFEHFVIDTWDTKDEADEAEIFFIGWFRALGLAYNLVAGGGGSLEPDETTREKMRRAKLGVKRGPQSEEHRQKLGESIAAAWTEERKQTFGESKIGNKNFEGRTHSEEAKEKNRQSKLGENNPMYGKPTSDNQKEAASKRWKGVKRGPMSEETKQKLREVRALQAKVPCSEETKAKIRQKALERAAVKKA